jgi:DNA-binding response OmpR family regulator
MSVLMKKILIVEDQVDVLNLLEIVLRAEDRKVFLTECGKQALEVARDTIPDVVLLDIMLPGGINGYEVARSLKKDPTTANCSIIVMTAKVQEQDKIEAWEAGADDFIGKPFNIVDLKNKVARFLE